MESWLPKKEVNQLITCRRRTGGTAGAAKVSKKMLTIKTKEKERKSPEDYQEARR